MSKKTLTGRFLKEAELEVREGSSTLTLIVISFLPTKELIFQDKQFS